jgi:transposase
MEQDKILMGQRQLQRWHVMKMVEIGKITLKEASEKIGVSYRQAKRIGRAIRDRGMKALVHGNRGRPSHRRLPEPLRERVLELARGPYKEFNDTHLTEVLSEREGIDLSRETVRRLRRGAAQEPKRKRRAPSHHKRRERMAQEGAMVLWDGSPHPWFGLEYPACCLMAAIDDARGKLLAARFFPFEGSSGYLWLLKTIVKRYGIPLVIYHDRHGALHRNDVHWTLEEQLAGRQEPTQVGLALEALSDQYVVKGPLSADKSISETLLGKPVIIEDAASDPRVQYPKEAKREGIASIISVPILLRGRTLGVLRLYTPVPCKFTEDDVEFLSAIANQSGLAIESAKMYEQVVKQVMKK